MYIFYFAFACGLSKAQIAHLKMIKWYENILLIQRTMSKCTHVTVIARTDKKRKWIKKKKSGGRGKGKREDWDGKAGKKWIIFIVF